jgi:general secretion pathway protein A
LSPEVLEHVRVLSDLQADENRLLQIVLLGQPGLLDTLKQPGLRQVEQVIFRRRQLQTLAAAEVKDYIEHRVSVARGGADDVWNLGVPVQETPLEPMFTIAAIETIAQVSRGVPRLVNAICDRALTVAWLARAGRSIAPSCSKRSRICASERAADFARFRMPAAATRRLPRWSSWP